MEHLSRRRTIIEKVSAAVSEELEGKMPDEAQGCLCPTNPAKAMQRVREADRLGALREGC